MKFALFLGCNIPARLPQYECSSRVVLGKLGVELVVGSDLVVQDLRIGKMLKEGDNISKGLMQRQHVYVAGLNETAVQTIK